MTVMGDPAATVELEREVGHRLEPNVGDRVVYSGPDPHDQTAVNDWNRRRTGQSLVVRTVDGWVHSIELGSRALDGYWSAKQDSVLVIGRAVYTDAARARALRHVELLAENAALRAEAEMLRGQTVESEYRCDLAQAVAREMVDQYPPKLFLPGDAEPARAEPIGPAKIVIRNAVFALGNGFVYQQMHEAEWYAAHLPSRVFSWEQVLGDGPCVEVPNQAGVTALFDVVARHRKYERDLHSKLWEFERFISDYARQVDLPTSDQERTGSIEEAGAILDRGVQVVARLATKARTLP